MYYLQHKMATIRLLQRSLRRPWQRTQQGRRLYNLNNLAWFINCLKDPHNYGIFSQSLIAPIYKFSWWYLSFLTPFDLSEDVVSSKPWDHLVRAIYNKTINLITIQFYSNRK